MPSSPDMQPISEYVPTDSAVLMELLKEQQRTNQLLTDLLQANWALIDALGETETVSEQSTDLDGNQRDSQESGVYLDGTAV